MNSPNLLVTRRSRRLIQKSINSEKDTERFPGLAITLDNGNICESGS